MPKKSSSKKEYIHYHKDGSVWAKGGLINGQPHGYWEWFRKDGTKMRSGYFDKGKQTGEWTTYDKEGSIYTITNMSKGKAIKEIKDFLTLISAPARRALESEGLTTLQKLAKRSEADILALHGVGPSALPKLRATLKEKGLGFAKAKKK